MSFRLPSRHSREPSHLNLGTDFQYNNMFVFCVFVCVLYHDDAPSFQYIFSLLATHLFTNMFNHLSTPLFYPPTRSLYLIDPSCLLWQPSFQRETLLFYTLKRKFNFFQLHVKILSTLSCTGFLLWYFQTRQKKTAVLKKSKI